MDGVKESLVPGRVGSRPYRPRVYVCYVSPVPTSGRDWKFSCFVGVLESVVEGIES